MFIPILINTGLFLSLSALHVYWALGGKWGLSVSIPKHPEGDQTFHPGIVSTLIVALGLAGFAAITFANSAFIHLPFEPATIRYATYGIAGIFILRAIGDGKYVGFTKRVKHTDFASYDDKYFSPLCVGISVLSLLIAFFSHTTP